MKILDCRNQSEAILKSQLQRKPFITAAASRQKKVIAHHFTLDIQDSGGSTGFRRQVAKWTKLTRTTMEKGQTW